MHNVALREGENCTGTKAPSSTIAENDIFESRYIKLALTRIELYKHKTLIWREMVQNSVTQGCDLASGWLFVING